MKALRTNANGLPRSVALLGVLVALGLADLDAEEDPLDVVAVVDAVSVDVKVAMLMVVLRLIGIPVPALAEAPVPIIPVPMIAAVVVAL